MIQEIGGKSLRKKSKKKLKFIDLFAGIGGIRLGMEAAGGKCVFSSEWDDHAKKTYKHMFGEEPHGDINAIDHDEIPKFDVLTAGFPCQPFSSIGKREGFSHETQGTLFHEILKILDHHRPSAFILENVKGLTHHKSGDEDTLEIIHDKLIEHGYCPQIKLLNASKFGVPQFRERVFIVGFRKDDYFRASWRFKWPVGSEVTATLGDDIIQSDVEGYSISKHLQKSYIWKKDDGRPRVLIPGKCSDVTLNTLVSTYHKIQRLTGTFVQDGPTGLRLLSVQECLDIMGFPKSFEIPVSRTQAYRQLGNSVAVPVVREVAHSVAAALAVK
jgi:DNA (cytosine-5)-methyltransferase 1